MGGEAAYMGILKVVQAIPAGHVMTYGQVAEAAGLPRRARLVGKVLADLPDGSDVPWHRVVNASGRISVRGRGSAAEQRRRLEREGVTFEASGRIDLGVYGRSTVRSSKFKVQRSKSR